MLPYTLLIPIVLGTKHFMREAKIQRKLIYLQCLEVPLAVGRVASAKRNVITAVHVAPSALSAPSPAMDMTTTTNPPGSMVASEKAKC